MKIKLHEMGILITDESKMFMLASEIILYSVSITELVSYSDGICGRAIK